MKAAELCAGYGGLALAVEQVFAAETAVMRGLPRRTQIRTTLVVQMGQGGRGMSRNRASAKAAGSRFERSIADWLAIHIDDRIDRRVKTGAKDRGDLAGWRHSGRRIVAELKDVTRMNLGGWIQEAEVERGNDDAHVALVIHKRRGVMDPGDQYVTLTLRDLVTLLTGERP